MRVNADLIKQIFHTGDQKILDSFKDLSIAEPVNIDETNGFTNLTASINPKSVKTEDYDFLVSFKDPSNNNFFGIEGKDLQVSGVVTNLDGSIYDYTADIVKLTLGISENAETDIKILKSNPKAKKLQPDDFIA